MREEKYPTRKIAKFEKRVRVKLLWYNVLLLVWCLFHSPVTLGTHAYWLPLCLFTLSH